MEVITMNRCANSEALARHEREVDKREKEYEYNLDLMFEELDDAILEIETIIKRYELQQEGREYVKDKM